MSFTAGVASVPSVANMTSQIFAFPDCITCESPSWLKCVRTLGSTEPTCGWPDPSAISTAKLNSKLSRTVQKHKLVFHGQDGRVAIDKHEFRARDGIIVT